MKILLIIFAIITLIIKLWENYISNNPTVQAKMLLNGGSIGLGITKIIQYILGATILIKILLKVIE